MKSWLGGFVLAGILTASGNSSEKVTFYLDWFPGPQFAGLFLAEDLGYFRDAGLTVEFVPFKFGSKSVEEIARSPDCALGTIEGYIFLQKRGPNADLRALAATLRESPAGFMSLSPTVMDSGNDFAGKRIGIHKFGTPLYRWFLQRAGLPEDTAVVRQVGDDLKLLTSGEIDLMQGYATEEFVHLRGLVGSRAKFLSFRELGFDSYSEIIFTTGGQLVKHPSEIQLFLAAARRGWQAALAHPEDALAALRYRGGPAFDDKFAAASLVALRPFLIRPGQPPLIAMDPEKWKQMESACVEMGFLSQVEPVENFLDTKLISAAPP